MLRKTAIPAFVMLSFACAVVFAFPCQASSPSPEKIKAYIGQLEMKLDVAQKNNDLAKVNQIIDLLEKQQVALTTATENEDEGLSNYKEDTNKALADLKAQIDKVSGDNKDAKVGGVIFFQWSKYTQGGTSKTPNNFDVTRAYLDVKKKLDWNASMRMTLDVARITGATRQNLFDYLKYAYVEMPLNVSSLQVVPFSMTAKVGLQHTVWIDWADKILNLRYIAKSIVDNEGLMSSSDFGLGGLGTVSIAGLPDIEYQATLLNGTGYATNESDSKKAMAMRVNANVYQDSIGGKILLGSYINIEAMKASLDCSSSNNQGGIELAYKHELGAANIEYITGSKSNKKILGTSIGGVYNVGTALGFLPNLSVFARFDNYDPNTTGANDDKKKTFYGVTYDWGKDVRLALDQQTSQTGSGAITSIMYLQSSITF